MKTLILSPMAILLVSASCHKDNPEPETPPCVTFINNAALAGQVNGYWEFVVTEDFYCSDTYVSNPGYAGEFGILNTMQYSGVIGETNFVNEGTITYSDNGDNFILPTNGDNEYEFIKRDGDYLYLKLVGTTTVGKYRKTQ